RRERPPRLGRRQGRRARLPAGPARAASLDRRRAVGRHGAPGGLGLQPAGAAARGPGDAGLRSGRPLGALAARTVARRHGSAPRRAGDRPPLATPLRRRGAVEQPHGMSSPVSYRCRDARRIAASRERCFAALVDLSTYVRWWTLVTVTPEAN